MDKSHRHIDILLFDGVNILDVAGMAQAFSSTNELAAHIYSLRYVSPAGTPVIASCGMQLQVDGRASCGSKADDLVIPGGRGVDDLLASKGVLDLISGWRSHQPERRLISVCSGALLLAQAGVLDGIIATTHWRRGQFARQQFPQVLWQEHKLYFDAGPVMTAAGVSSGIDLALALIRRDCGVSTALQVAREMVVYLHRTGGQMQFSDLLESQFSQDRSLRTLIDTLFEDPQKPWTLESMAQVAGLTPRTLSRRFAKSYTTSPVKFLERLRVKTAADLLGGGTPVGKAITLSGFYDFQQMQRAFKRHLGTTIGAYRDRFAPHEKGAID